MSNRPKGKYVTIDTSNPAALGICDKSGFVFRRQDMIKQMEWRGNALVWTGFIVGRPFADVPNEQLRPPILPPDPVPIKLPRTKQPTTVTWSNQGTIWSLLPIYTWDSWIGSEDGVPAAPESVRKSSLEQEVEPPQSYGVSGYAPPYPDLTQAQILSNLQGASFIGGNDGVGLGGY